MRMRLATVLLCAALALPALGAASHRDRVAAALADLDAADMDGRWQFTMAVQQDDALSIVTHDPSRGGYEIRQLQSVDGAAPSDRQLRKFREEEKKRLDERDPDTANYAYLVDLDSLRLEATEGDVLRFSFAPRVAQFDEAEQLQGTLRLNDDTGQVEQIVIRNRGELSPAFSVTVAHYLLALEFVDFEDARLLGGMTSEVRGKAGFLKSFDVNTQVSFSDYRQVE